MDVAAAVDQLGSRTQGLVSAGRLTAAGVHPQVLGRAVTAGTVTRVRPGVYARDELPALPAHLVTGVGVWPEYSRHVRAALLHVGGTATASGLTAAILFGWALLHEPGETFDLAVRHGRSGARAGGVRITQRRAAGRSLLVVPGADPLRVTSAVQTVLDCCRALPFLDGLVLCDSALRSAMVTLAELQSAASALSGLAGADRLRAVLRAADPRCGSMLESVFRGDLVAAGITGFGTQVVVTDQLGRYVLRVDFCFEAQRLVVEVDGAAWHPDAVRDRSRDNRLAAAGWRVLRLRWAEVRYDRDGVMRLLRDALAAPAAAPVRAAA